MSVKFARFSKAEKVTVDLIVQRARGLFLRTFGGFDEMELRMDLAACHAICPLKLDALAAADDFNFGHDILGIVGHMDRETGKLTDFFIPRFAKPKKRRTYARRSV